MKMPEEAGINQDYQIDQTGLELAQSLTAKEIQGYAEQIQGTADEWRERGYAKPLSYIGTDGELVMLALRGGEYYDDVGHRDSKEWRLRFDDYTTDIKVPAEMRCTNYNWRGNNPSYQVYDTNLWVEQTGKDLPDNFSPVVEKFGGNLFLTMKSYHKVEFLFGENIAEGYYFDFSDLIKEAYSHHEEEVYRIEDRAIEASSLVKRGMLRSAARYNELREQAYRKEINRLNEPQND